MKYLKPDINTVKYLPASRDVIDVPYSLDKLLILLKLQINNIKISLRMSK